MIKLLLVSPQTEKSKGGIAVWTDVFIQNCGRFGISCDLLNIATIGSRAEQGNAKRNFFDEFVRTKSIFSNLRKMLREGEYDASHVNTSCGSFGLIRDYLTVLKIKRRQPLCKVIVHFHCDIQTQCRSKISRFFLSRMLKKADTALVLNQFNCRYLHDSYGIQSKVASNFIDADMVRKEPKIISPDIQDAIFVGYVRPEKGIREMYELAQKFPFIKFRLIGEIHDEVAGWDKPSNIVLCGKKNHSDILSEMDRADVFVFLSHSEGFSIALLEAMTRGLPCIATDVGANREMLENNGGTIVPIGDTPTTVAALESMRNQKIREEMSAWNIEKVRSCYIAEKVISKITGLYN